MNFNVDLHTYETIGRGDALLMRILDSEATLFNIDALDRHEQELNKRSKF